MGEEEPKFKVEFAVGDLVKNDVRLKITKAKSGSWTAKGKGKGYGPFSAANPGRADFCRLKDIATETTVGSTTENLQNL